MDWKEEERIKEAKYNSLMASEGLSKSQKKLVKELKVKLEGNLYDPQFLFDWVKNIPFEGIWSGYDGKEQLLLQVVGVVESTDDFYYVGFSQEGTLHMVLCNDEYIPTKGNVFIHVSREDMRRDIKNLISGISDSLLLFRPEKHDKNLIS